VLGPAHDVAERVAGGVLGRGRGDDHRAAAAQHLGLEQRIAEPDRRRAQVAEDPDGVALAQVQGLGRERAVVDAAEQDAIERERVGGLGRAAVDDLADGPRFGEPVRGLLHRLEDGQALEALLDLGSGERIRRRAHRARGGAAPGSVARPLPAFALAVISSR
jgi:hypothetical protein